MPLYRNWNDFDTLRNKSKVLVIYGAGHMGLRLLNHHKIIPDFFCDKNARIIKKVTCNVAGESVVIHVFTLRQLMTKLSGREADILVSNVDGKIIKKLHRTFYKTKFTENTVIYFHHNYNIPNKNFTNEFCIYKINNKINEELSLIEGESFNYIASNFDIRIIYKNGYFPTHFSSVEEYENFMRNIKRKYKFQNGRVHVEIDSEVQNESENLDSDKIIFFCDSRFLNFYCRNEYRMKSILMQLLNRNSNINYKIENYSIGGFSNEQVMFQLTNTYLNKNSIVIIDRIEEPYLLAVAKQYCQKYSCRLIYYFIPNIFSRNTITDYEKWFIEQSAKKENETYFNKKLREKIKLAAKAMDIEFYEPPDDFFNSNKIIFLDHVHFGDYGIEIIAKHLHEIITHPVPSHSINNICEEFHITPEEKIKYANSIMPYLVPDIPIYLNGLKKNKQNFANCGAIVMNCNPFTLGHRYLIEYAASKVEHLYIFVVEEDKSEISFRDRFKLVKKNIADLSNITVLPSSKFIISTITFAGYFGKSTFSEEQAVEQDVSFDLLIFATAIAPILNIKTRFVGEEPLDPVTKHYNEEMKKILPEYGCNVIEIPRLQKNGSTVSASHVRKLLKEKNFREIEKIVPKVTLKYLMKSCAFA
jgi:hypothetical protein